VRSVSVTVITSASVTKSHNRPERERLPCFTTVGYGDIVPHSAQGKLLAICTALLGTTHGVTFVALVLQALTQHSPAKSQE
jgi:Ion channel